MLSCVSWVDTKMWLVLNIASVTSVFWQENKSVCLLPDVLILFYMYHTMQKPLTFLLMSTDFLERNSIPVSQCFYSQRIMISLSIPMRYFGQDRLFEVG